MQFATWCAGGNKDSFFTNTYCQQLYMNHIKTFVNRLNPPHLLPLPTSHVPHQDCCRKQVHMPGNLAAVLHLCEALQSKSMPCQCAGYDKSVPLHA